MVNIGFDMMGGDFSPLEAVKGVQQFLQHQQTDAVSVLCIGQENEVIPLLKEYEIFDKVEFVHAPDVVGYNEHPTKALREKPNSSIGVGFKLLASEKIHAFASAGNTGAMLVGSMFSLKPIQGILRPTIATVLPQINGSTSLLLDAGLNVDCKPEQLNQFAWLGNIYAKEILEIQEPKIALINIGEEEGKGNVQAQATHQLLKENQSLHFIGNVEGRDFFNNKADVFVCDGFTGNIILKMAESFYDIAKSKGLENDDYFSRFHYENYGGTPVLGVSRPVIIGHGISNAKAFYNMLLLTQKMITSKFCQTIEQNILA